MAASSIDAQQRMWCSVSSGVRSTPKSNQRVKQSWCTRCKVGSEFEYWNVSKLRNKPVVLNCSIELLMSWLCVIFRSRRRQRNCSASTVSETTCDCGAPFTCCVVWSCNCVCSDCLRASKTACFKLTLEEQWVIRVTPIIHRVYCWGNWTWTAMLGMSRRMCGGVCWCKCSLP